MTTILAGMLLAACAGGAAAPAADVATKEAGRRPSAYPLVYPVSDQTRSVVRSVRERLNLTAQHLQALGCDYETSLALFAVLCDWSEPRRETLDRLRTEYHAARSSHLADEAVAGALRERLNESADAPLSAEARERLEAQLATRLARIEDASERYERAAQAMQGALAPLRAKVEAVLTPAQRRQWAAVEPNVAAGVPMAAWFVPDLADEQRLRLSMGEPLGAVLTADQVTIARDAAANYVSCADDVYRAELKFFFGRDLGVASATQVTSDR